MGFNENNSSLSDKKMREVLEKGDNSVTFVHDEKQNSLKMIASNGKLWELLSSAARLDQDRPAKYMDYDQMEDDALIASALELVTDDATQYSEEASATVWVSPDSEYRNEITELFKSIDLENKVWGWVYNIAKYGDFFLKVDKEESEGVTHVSQDIHPKDIYRMDIDGDLAGFMFSGDDKCTISRKPIVTCGPASFVHFINNHKPNFEKVSIEVEGKDGEESRKICMSSAYGSSMLQNARRVYKILNLLEVSLALARLARSPMIRIYYVNTTGMDPTTRKELVKDIKEEFKSELSINVKTDWYENKYSPLNNTSDLFIPITGDVGDMRTETVGGDINIRDIVDIEYMRNKLFAALRTPKQYFGFEECLRYSTEVCLLDGTNVCIGEIAENIELYLGKYVYSCSTTGVLEAAPIVGAKKTRKDAKFLRVILDNGKCIDATPDHLFLCRNGEFLRTGELSQGTSLMPFYIIKQKNTERNSDYVKQNDEDSWVRKDVFSLKTVFGIKHCPQDSYIMHKDGNLDNCDPLNLEVSPGNDVDIYYRDKGSVDYTNHSVISVEVLDIVEDAYDIQVGNAYHTFALSSGIFVHNSVPASIAGGQTLTRLDIRYARLVKKLKRALLEGLYRLVHIHLSFKHQTAINMSGVSLSTVPISSAEEDTKMEYLERKIGLAQSVLDLMTGSGAEYDLNYLISYVFSTILDFPGFDFAKLKTSLPKSPEVPAEVQDFADKLILMRESKCNDRDIVTQVREFLSKFKSTSKFVPRRTKEINAPTRLGEEFENRKVFKEGGNENT